MVHEAGAAAMSIAIIALVSAAGGLFLGFLAGALARTARRNDEAAAEHLAAPGEHETFVEDPGSSSGVFDSLRDLRIAGKALYSLTLYADGSGEYTLSDRDRDDPMSYCGTDD